LQDLSRFDLHYDGRNIQRTSQGKSRTFPMSSEISLRVRPFVRWLHLTYQKMFLGRIDDKSLRTSDARRSKERYHIMIDELPMNMYIKAGRTAPVYGLRRPNHSKWIREKAGFNSFSTVDAVTIGGTPNVPYMHFSQMVGDPDSANEEAKRDQFPWRPKRSQLWLDN
jgi:hypothetical protein